MIQQKRQHLKMLSFLRKVGFNLLINKQLLGFQLRFITLVNFSF